MERPPTTPEARAEFDRVCAAVVARGAVLGRMMGTPMIYLAGKGFAGLWGDAMTFRLEQSELAEAMDVPGARPFDPSGGARPMKAWVEIPLAAASEWNRLADLALAAAVARAKGGTVS